MAAEYDKLYLRLFQDPLVAHDCIQGLVLIPDRYRVEMLEVVGATYVSDSGRKRVSDIVWKIRVQCLDEPGKEPEQTEILYVLFEFQSRQDAYMGLRALVYAGLLLQRLQSDKQFRSDGLPDTLSVVIYNGTQRWMAATEVSGLLKHAIPSLREDQLVHRYRLIDEAAWVAGGSLPANNLAAALFTLEHPRSAQDIVRVLRWLDGRLSGKEHARLRRDFTNLVRWILRSRGFNLRWRADLKECLRMAELQGQTVWDRVAENARSQGRSEGRIEGEINGQRKMLRSALVTRFDPLPGWVDERLVAASPEDMERWMNRLVSEPAIELERIFLS